MNLNTEIGRRAESEIIKALKDRLRK
jgi:hypothetical protein